MKLSDFKQLLRETVNSGTDNYKRPIREGLLDSVVMYIVDKLVKSKTKKYFDALSKDPQFLEAKQRVRKALEDFEKGAEARIASELRYQKQKDAFAKKYGQEKADEIYDDYDYLYGYKYRPSRTAKRTHK